MRIALVVCLVFPLAGAARGGLFDALDPGQRKTLLQGRQIVETREVEGCAWPEVTVYQWVDAPPAALAAIFFDYASAPGFIPNVKKARIASWITSREADVDYTLDIPVLPDEEYTARNTLSALPGGGYLVKWKLIKARHTKASVGEFRVEPAAGGGLVRYRALTTPGSAIAGLLRGRALAQTSETVAAICAEALRLRSADPAALDGKIQLLREALAEVISR